jgi:hypothetical protein
VIKAVAEKSDQLEKILRDKVLLERYLKGELSEKPDDKKEAA